MFEVELVLCYNGKTRMHRFLDIAICKCKREKHSKVINGG